jgi:hypothetical protein
LLAAIKEYEASKWKVIGQKVGKPAKVYHSSPLVESTADSGVTRVADVSSTRLASNTQRSILAGRSNIHQHQQMHLSGFSDC